MLDDFGNRSNIRGIIRNPKLQVTNFKKSTTNF